MNAVSTILPKGPANLQYQSRIFHSAIFSVHLKEKPWLGGFQFCWISSYSSRKPDFFRQKYENKFITPTGQSVFAHSRNLMTKAYNSFQKVIFPVDSSGPIKCAFNNPPEKVSSKVPIFSIHDPELNYRKIFYKKIFLVKMSFWKRIQWFRQSRWKIFTRSPTSSCSKPDKCKTNFKISNFLDTLARHVEYICNNAITNFSSITRKSLAENLKKNKTLCFFQTTILSSIFRLQNVECSFDKAAEWFLPKNRKFMAHYPKW